MGDFLAGSVGSIWSLAGLFFVYIAFLGQKVQILQQQLDILSGQLELKYTRLQIMEQKKEMEVQNITLQHQKFENTFFQMIGLLHSIVDSMDIRKNSDDKIVIQSGRDCFKTFYKDFKNNLSAVILGQKGITILLSTQVENVDIEHCKSAYQLTYDKYKSDLSHYFRTLFYIFKFVDDSDFTKSIKLDYANLIRAQLSSYEQIMLFYNCKMSYARSFLPYIKTYNIFKSIDDTLIVAKNHRDSKN